MRVEDLAFSGTSWLWARGGDPFAVPDEVVASAAGPTRWARLVERSGPLEPGYYLLLPNYESEAVVNRLLDPTIEADTYAIPMSVRRNAGEFFWSTDAEEARFQAAAMKNGRA